MALNLSGTSGVSGVAGSVGAPSIIGDDANTGISFPAEDTIKFSTGGVERMVINNSGITGIAVDVNAPAFRVHKSSNQTIGNNSNTLMQFNIADHNVGTAYDTSTYLFTCPVGKAGIYFFGANGTIDDINNDDYCTLFFYLNGSHMPYSYHSYNWAANNNRNTSSFQSNCIQLAEGDTVGAYIKHNRGGNEQLLATSSHFFGFKLAT